MLNIKTHKATVTYHFGLKILCDGYVIASSILFDGHLIK